jgi:hypothetical protein
MRTTLLHLQLDGTIERYIKTVEEHLQKVITSHQRDWDTRLPIFLLAYRVSTYRTTGLVFGRELRLPCDLLFGTPLEKEQPTIDHEANLVDHLHDIHNCAYQHLKLASDSMKTRYDRLSNCMDYHECDKPWLYCPTHMNLPSSNPHGGAHAR